MIQISMDSIELAVSKEKQLFFLKSSRTVVERGINGH